MTEPQACPECLRRARLLAHLAPYIERTVNGAPGVRAPELLRLGSEELAATAAPWALIGRGDPVLLERLVAFGVDACAHRGALEGGARALPP